MDSQLKLLKMVEEGKVTAEKAFDLMNEGKDDKFKGEKFLKVTVLSEEEKVNINVPLNVIKTLINSYDSEKPIDIKNVDIDIKEVFKAIENEVKGKILEVETDKQELVEVFIE